MTANRGRAALIAACAIAMSACADAPPPAPIVVVAPPAQKHALLAIELDPQAPQRIQADIAYLASPELAGRGTGEPGAKLAAAYVEARFRKLGLVPFGDARDTFTQAFRARVGATAAPPVVAWPKAKRTHVGTEHVAVADGSSSGTASGTPVFVGYGISAPALDWDDYAKADLKGHIAFVLDGAPSIKRAGRDDALHDYRSIRYKLRTAREHGAAGVVVVLERSEPSPGIDDASSMGLPAIVVTPLYAEQILRFRRDAKGFDHFVTPGFDKAARMIWDYPTQWPATRPIAAEALEITTKVDPVEADAWNVVGLLPARPDSPNAKEFVVVGAHYDHLGHGGTSASRAPGSHEIHPGADDNASGTALLLEAARTLSSLPNKLDRNIVFVAFGAEELGVLGSRYLVDHPPPAMPMRDVVAMINADMVGRLRDDKVVVDGAGTANEWPKLYEAASRGLDLHLVVGSEGFGASDHTNFTAARVPVAFFFTGAHEDYHRPSDTADKINAAGEARIATMAARLAVGVANAPARMAFVDAPADPHSGGVRGGFKVSLGTLPDYAFTGKGVRLTGSRADSPASRAGLRAGDVIVKVAAHEISNIHDYMFALGDLEAGRGIQRNEIDRDGKRVVLEIVPAPPR